MISDSSGKLKVIIVLALLVWAVVQLTRRDERLDLLLLVPSSSDKISAPGVKNVEYSEDHFRFDDIAVPGAVTVIDFYSPACGACRALQMAYKPFLELRPDVAIRRVEMPKTWSVPWAEKVFDLDIRATPHIIIVDYNGKIIVEDQGMDKAGLNLFMKWMVEEEDESLDTKS